MHRDTVARYLRRLADERRAVAAEWDRKIQECRWASDWAAQEREWAIRIDRLAEAAECGPWPPEWAHLCIQCIDGQDPEEGRCSVCDRADCCIPMSGALQCEICGELYCPDCLRWIPSCQRGLYGEPRPPWEK
jgi:hypothetical protein